MKNIVIAIACLLLLACCFQSAMARHFCASCQGNACQPAEFPCGTADAKIQPVPKAWPWTPPKPAPVPAPKPVVVPPVAPVVTVVSCCCEKRAGGRILAVAAAPVRLTAKVLRVAVLPVRAVLERKPVRHLLGRLFCRR